VTTFRHSLLSAVAAAAAVVCVEAAAHSVSQKGKAFAPATLAVKAGETLTFRNDDDVTHNAFSTSKGNEFNSKVQLPGNASSVTFKEAGTVDVRCAFHPKMKLTVVVSK
jgi:plastocyanin